VTTCTRTLDDDEDFVMALFAPQYIEVASRGPGTVSVNGVECSIDRKCGPFERNAVPTLVATGPSARWLSERCDAMGVTPAKAPTCVLIVNRRRGVAVAFGNAEVPAAVPPAFGDAQLRVRVTGDGSGSVHSQSRNIDCGGRCKYKGNLGDIETLVADAAAGSRFAGWNGKGVCSAHPTALTCKASLGTSVEARFDPAAAKPPPPGPFVFQAQLKGKVRASGRGGGRKISFTVVVNAPAVVSARLRRGKKQVRQKTWNVPRGQKQLTLTVPKTVRRGQHRLTVTIAARGARKTFGRNVSLPG
jgi:hypothetical protein